MEEAFRFLLDQVLNAALQAVIKAWVLDLIQRGKKGTAPTHNRDGSDT